MITYETVIQQIEKLAAEAIVVATEQQAREKLAAIRALCDVVLDDKFVSPKSQISPTNFVSTSIPTPVYTQPVANLAQKLEEEDANGESIFDF